MNQSGKPRGTARSSRLWMWALIGAGIGLFDFAILWFLDANLTILGRDMTVPVLLSFLIPYGALGWAVGRILAARALADADAATIQAQLTRLEQTQRDLVQQEKLAGIGRLAAGVAHEIRNPLGVIRASAAMVRESFDPREDPHRALGFICEEIDRLEGLISGLLTFARPTEIKKQTVAFEKLVERAISLARSEASAHGVELETRFEPGLPPIEGDPDLLCQVIYNLVLNAIQILDGGGRIAVCVAPAAGPSAHASGIRVDVRDDGPGVPLELAEQIFEPFVTTRASGTGLGLPMALRLIEAHSGKLTLVRGAGLGTGGRGACFRVEIPTHDAIAETVEAVA